MGRNIEARLTRLERPPGDRAQATQRSFHFLRRCHEILSAIDGEPMPSDADLWAWAEAEARSGQPPNFTAILEAVWREQDAPL
jgi:hypothetical protein